MTTPAPAVPGGSTLPAGLVPNGSSTATPGDCAGEQHGFGPEALLPNLGPTVVLCGCGTMKAATDDGVTWQFGVTR